MSYRPLLPSLLTLSALGLAACGEDTTQPNSAAEPSPGAPEFALVSNTWRTRADMWGVERSSYAAVNTTNALGQTIVYVIGGRSLAGNPLGNVMAYNVYTNTWTVKAPLPVATASIHPVPRPTDVSPPGGASSSCESDRTSRRMAARIPRRILSASQAAAREVAQQAA